MRYLRNSKVFKLPKFLSTAQAEFFSSIFHLNPKERASADQLLKSRYLSENSEDEGQFFRDKRLSNQDTFSSQNTAQYNLDSDFIKLLSRNSFNT